MVHQTFYNKTYLLFLNAKVFKNSIKMKTIRTYILPILLSIAVGYSASVIQESSMIQWYPYLVKPAGTPPGIVFAIVWSVVYLLIGITGGMLAAKKYNEGIRLWFSQLLLNFLWSISFFYLRSISAGLINILMLDMLVCYLIYATWRPMRYVSYMLLPYILWLLYATYLNIGIFVLN